MDGSVCVCKCYYARIHIQLVRLVSFYIYANTYTDIYINIYANTYANIYVSIYTNIYAKFNIHHHIRLTFSHIYGLMQVHTPTLYLYVYNICIIFKRINELPEPHTGWCTQEHITA